MQRLHHIVLHGMLALCANGNVHHLKLLFLQNTKINVKWKWHDNEYI